MTLFSVETLMEEFKPVFAEKREFEYQDKLMTIALFSYFGQEGRKLRTL